jgi:hypothetical protein
MKGISGDSYNDLTEGCLARSNGSASNGPPSGRKVHGELLVERG